MVTENYFDAYDDNFTGVGLGDVDSDAVVLTDKGVDAIVTDTFPRHEAVTVKRVLQAIFTLSNGTAGSAVDLDTIAYHDQSLGGPGIITNAVERLADFGFIQKGSMQ